MLLLLGHTWVSSSVLCGLWGSRVPVSRYGAGAVWYGCWRLRLDGANPVFVTVDGAVRDLGGNWCWSGAIGGQGLDQPDRSLLLVTAAGEGGRALFLLYAHFNHLYCWYRFYWVLASLGLCLSLEISFKHRNVPRCINTKQAEVKRRTRSLALKQISCLSSVWPCWQDMLYFKGMKWLH